MQEVAAKEEERRGHEGADSGQPETPKAATEQKDEPGEAAGADDDDDCVVMETTIKVKGEAKRTFSLKPQNKEVAMKGIRKAKNEAVAEASRKMKEEQEGQKEMQEPTAAKEVEEQQEGQKEVEEPTAAKEVEGQQSQINQEEEQGKSMNKEPDGKAKVAEDSQPKVAVEPNFGERTLMRMANEILFKMQLQNAPFRMSDNLPFKICPGKPPLVNWGRDMSHLPPPPPMPPGMMEAWARHMEARKPSAPPAPPCPAEPRVSTPPRKHSRGAVLSAAASITSKEPAQNSNSKVEAHKSNSKVQAQQAPHPLPPPPMPPPMPPPAAPKKRAERPKWQSLSLPGALRTPKEKEKPPASEEEKEQPAASEEERSREVERPAKAARRSPPEEIEPTEAGDDPAETSLQEEQQPDSDASDDDADDSSAAAG